MILDYSRDELFEEFGLQTLKDRYMLPEETSPQERFAYVSKAFATNKAHAERMYEYSSKHWLSYSTPILSFGKGGLPISCYLPYLGDTKEELVQTSTECRYLSMMGGGIGLGVGLRSKDKKSSGIIPHLKTYDADTLAYKQGETRRGSIAAYLDISHPEIFEFLEMRKPTGGDVDLKCINLHHGINIPDAFMQLVENAIKDKDFDDSWELIDPHSKEVRQVVSAKRIWERILEMRHFTGEPFLHFIDNSNRLLPKYQKDIGLSVKQTNLCTEIILPTDEQRTAVCCLSSVNLEYYDDWKDHPTFIADVVEFLDNVIEYFITNAPIELDKAKYSAWRERAIGIGALGFHAYLQKKGVPFETAIADSINRRIFKHIREQADAATKLLAVERGACPDSRDSTTPVRNARLLAIAPNASSSIIVGNTSPSIEPYRSNAYLQKTMSGFYVQKNKFLQEVLAGIKGLDLEATWRSIVENKGSVQHLECLNDYQKETFKTATEIDQRWIIQHAAVRQAFIDQTQSLNTFFASDAHITYFHKIHFDAWKFGLPTMYYCRSSAKRLADNVGSQIQRQKINVSVNGEPDCLSCEG